MPRLAFPIEQLKSDYEVLVIGSGYGGGIAASRLARAGRRVCVIERGREIRPGEYPRTELELLAEVQIDAPITRVGSPTALFDLRFNDDINVVVGCGLGGSSLINAAIALRPDPRLLADPCWPAEIRDQPLDPWFARAEAMLRPTPYPESYPRLHKTAALEQAAAHLNEPCTRVPLLITFEEPAGGVNHAGATQHACVGCGDCVSGCNYAAKNSVLMNYLPDAVKHGAEIYTGLRARHIEREDEHWRVQIAAQRRGGLGVGAGLERRHRHSRRRHAGQHRDPAAFAGARPGAFACTGQPVFRQWRHPGLCLQRGCRHQWHRTGHARDRHDRGGRVHARRR